MADDEESRESAGPILEVGLKALKVVEENKCGAGQVVSVNEEADADRATSVNARREDAGSDLPKTLPAQFRNAAVMNTLRTLVVDVDSMYRYCCRVGIGVGGVGFAF